MNPRRGLDRIQLPGRRRMSLMTTLETMTLPNHHQDRPSPRRTQPDIKHRSRAMNLRRGLGRNQLLDQRQMILMTTLGTMTRPSHQRDRPSPRQIQPDIKRRSRAMSRRRGLDLCRPHLRPHSHRSKRRLRAQRMSRQLNIPPWTITSMRIVTRLISLGSAISTSAESVRVIVITTTSVGRASSAISAKATTKRYRDAAEEVP